MLKIFTGLFFSFLLLNSCGTKDRASFTIEDSPYVPAASLPDTLPKIKTAANIVFVDALKLSADYIDNEVKADKDYKGKTLVVKGRVQEISKGMAGDIYVVFTGANRQRVILCQFNNEEQAATLHKNDVISLKGICEGLMGSVLMNNCEMDTTAVAK